MKLENQNSNVFVERMAKLFGDLSHRTPNLQRPASPRMTCTRLRRFRQTRQDLVLEYEFGPDSGLTQTDNGLDESNNQRESFADWVERNQQIHKELADKQNHCCEEVKKNNNIEANQTVQGFAHFSTSALLEVAKNPNTPVITLKWLAAHHNVEVRQALATNENIGSDILHILVRDGEDSVKATVLDNKNISQADILRLCGENNPSIAERAKYKLSQIHKLDQKSKPEINHRRAMAETANIDIATARSIRRKRK